MTKDRVARIQFTYSELASRLALKPGTEVLRVEETFDKVSVVVSNRDIGIRPSSRIRTLTGSSLESVFRPEARKPARIDPAKFKEVMKYMLHEHGSLLITGQTEAFIERAIDHFDEWEDEDDGI